MISDNGIDWFLILIPRDIVVGDRITYTARFIGFFCAGILTKALYRALCTCTRIEELHSTIDSQTKFTLKTTLKTNTVIGPLTSADHLQAANQGMDQWTFTRNGMADLLVWRVSSLAWVIQAWLCRC